MSAHEHRQRAPAKVRCFVLSVSDSRTEETDEGGKLCRDRVGKAGHDLAGYRIVRDEPDEVRAVVRELAAGDLADAVLVTGGTGVSARDRTFEALDALLERRLPGFGELFRVLSYQDVGPAAMLSRATAGVIARTVVFAMPGSPDAVRFALDRLIMPEVRHVVGEVRR